ncbi:hypothetical protein HD597_005536 [Nonomuraea thailandensis]|uniref:Uncharacterized protein n=1 Tax=Nonomuraea thailandensis TaxID=1188745 RepID=A0A9X2GMW1_9ACTN|nr:hypothetical protein [Nonomuraea thailandensis]MCP2358516.1 hypothetical protein [Nonomuraea thailandensis]
MKWIPELCDDAVDQACDDIVARYGDEIPADLALLDISALSFIGVTAWNEYGIGARAENVTALAQCELR